MRRYAENTKVPVDRSRAAIERLLTNYGADEIATGTSHRQSMVAFKAQGRYVRFVLLRPVEQTESKRLAEERRRWRSLFNSIKSKLDCAESGISTFEEEFMPWTVMPNGMTVSEQLQPMISDAYERGSMRPLLPAFVEKT